jgi:GTPase SAR1 family protein
LLKITYYVKFDNEVFHAKNSQNQGRLPTMAHLRQRHLLKSIKQLMQFSPLVGLLGHRQVGKTTLMEGLVRQYLTFDDQDTYLSANKSPKKFLEQFKDTNIGLDECQLCDGLFPALKDRVRQNKRPGQFLLSGSVRFTAKSSIKESLTGRIMTVDLFPLSLSELYERPIPAFWKQALYAKRVDENLLHTLDPKSTRAQAEKYKVSGGLPGVCFIRSEASRNLRLQSYIETILDRDIRRIVPTTLPYPQILNLLRSVARYHSQPLNLSHLTKTTGISTPTIKKLLFAFEAVFLIRSMPVEGDFGGVVYFFEDICEADYLAGGQYSDFTMLTQLLYQEIRSSLIYANLEHSVRFFQYRTRAGVVVPICVESQGQVIGIVPTHDEKPSRKEAAAGDSLLKSYANAKVIFCGPSNQPQVLNDRSIVIPYFQAF